MNIIKLAFFMYVIAFLPLLFVSALSLSCFFSFGLYFDRIGGLHCSISFCFPADFTLNIFCCFSAQQNPLRYIIRLVALNYSSYFVCFLFLSLSS